MPIEPTEDVLRHQMNYQNRLGLIRIEFGKTSPNYDKIMNDTVIGIQSIRAAATLTDPAVHKLVCGMEELMALRNRAQIQMFVESLSN